MFKIMIIHDETIDNEDITEAFRIMCISCGKIIALSLENQELENFITPFVTNMVFQNIVLFWIIQFKKPNFFIFNITVLLGYLITHVIILPYIHNGIVWYLNTILKLPNTTNIIECVHLRHKGKSINRSTSTNLLMMIQEVVVTYHFHRILQNKH